jgi:hypothetical protein
MLLLGYEPERGVLNRFPFLKFYVYHPVVLIVTKKDLNTVC